MYHYIYDGPVMQFGVCVCNRFQAETYAKSEAAAKRNFSYQFKKLAKQSPNSAPIIFTNKIDRVLD